MEFVVPGIMKIADIEDIVTLIEPNSLFISATDNEGGSRGAKAIYEYAKDYFKMGELKLKIHAGEHIFNPSMREEAYSFLDQKLRGKLDGMSIS
jgi:hypothetical protein